MTLSRDGPQKGVMNMTVFGRVPKGVISIGTSGKSHFSRNALRIQITIYFKEGDNLKRKKPKQYTKLNSLLEIPREVASTDIKITINGFNEILIENYKNILEYQDILIKINTFEGAVTIYGFGLKLEQMTEDDIKVNGKIDTIEFERIVDE